MHGRKGFFERDQFQQVRAKLTAPLQPVVTFLWATGWRKSEVLTHDFRRTVARRMERAGVPRSTAKSMLGHKTDAMYSRYSITDEAMQHEAAAKLDAFAAMEGTARKPKTTRNTRVTRPLGQSWDNLPKNAARNTRARVAK
jgi:integrase